MSADNWTTCPKCIAKLKEEQKEVAAKPSLYYGKVSVKKYEELVDEARAIATKEPEMTLREDYSIGISDDGEFYVSYRGLCATCNFEFKFKEKRKAIVL